MTEKQAKKKSSAAKPSSEDHVASSDDREQRKKAKKQKETDVASPGIDAAAKRAAKNATKKAKKLKRKAEKRAQEPESSASEVVDKAEAIRLKRKAKRERRRANKIQGKEAASVDIKSGKRAPEEVSKDPLAKKRKKDSGPPTVLMERTTAEKQVTDQKAVECFLTGLAYTATEEHIKAHFKDVGPCKVQLLDGKGRGTAFLTCPSAAQAIQACAYQGSKIHGRWINVRLCEVRSGSRAQQDEADASDKPSERLISSSRPEGCMSAVLTILKNSAEKGHTSSITEDDVWTFLQKWECEATNVNMLEGRETGACRGMAFADFEDPDMVDKVVKLSGQLLKGSKCLIRYKMPKR